ncbi:hypothetical protein [Streptomyces sp. MN13]
MACVDGGAARLDQADDGQEVRREQRMSVAVDGCVQFWLGLASHSAYSAASTQTAYAQYLDTSDPGGFSLSALTAH